MIDYLIFLLQESNRLLIEERGYIKLKNMQRKLRARQQYMISQVSLLYPVKILVGPAQEQELESYPGSSKLGNVLVVLAFDLLNPLQ